MTIYTQYQKNGSIINDVIRSTIKKSSGENNSTSTFRIDLYNPDGKNSSEYTVGDEIDIYAQIDTNPPTTKLFTGILEDIKFKGNKLKDTMTLKGKDYSVRMLDRTVEPEVYNNLPAGSIVKDIINKYTNDITFTNVDDTDTTIEKITFNHTPVFDAVKKLAKLSDSSFYIDNDKDLHFNSESSVDSNLTFDNSNVTKADFTTRRNSVFNEIWVYGDRYLDSYKEEFTAGSPVGGSVFTLNYKPHNTQVDVGSPITLATRQKGGVLGMTSEVTSGTNYLVSYNDKQIIFVSGTDIGYDSIPSSGTLVSIDYQRLLPIVKMGRNQSSINEYGGKRIKVIKDDNIKNPQTAEDIMKKELEDNDIPKKEGNLDIHGVVDVTPTQTCTVNLPYHNVDNKTYDILEATYNFDKINNLKEEVLSIKVNKKLNDITDTIKDIINNIKDIQAGDIDESDIITRYELATGSLTIRHSGVVVSTRTMGSSFILGNPGPATNPQAGGILGSVIASGINFLGNSADAWTVQYSGCYP